MTNQVKKHLITESVQPTLTNREWEIVKNLLHRELKNPVGFNNEEIANPTATELHNICDQMMLAIGWDGHK